MKKTIYLLASLVALSAMSCKKDTPATTPSNTNNNNNNNSNTVTVNSPAQFTGTINGTAYSLVSGSVYSSGTSSDKHIGGYGAQYNTGAYESFVDNINTGQPFLGIYKGTLQFALSNNMPDTASFDAFFNVNTYSYSINYANGIEVDWIDANGNSYSTSFGTGSQTGSSFKIIAKHAQGLVYGYYTVAVMATFNCTLYNNTGGSVTLTNGTYVGTFQSN